MDFGEAFFVVGEVAEAEGGGDEVDGVVGEGQMEGVGFDGDDVVRRRIFLAEGEHLVGEVYGEDGGGRCGGRLGRMFEEGQRHVAGAAAEVEGDGLGVLEDGAEEAGGAGPPVAVDAGGEEWLARS